MDDLTKWVALREWPCQKILSVAENGWVLVLPCATYIADDISV